MLKIHWLHFFCGHSVDLEPFGEVAPLQCSSLTYLNINSLIGLIYVKIQNLICKFVAFCPHIIHHSKFYQNQTQADRDETVYVKIDRRQLTQSTHKLHCKAVREAPLNPSLLLCPRPVGGGGGGIKRSSASVVRLSV